MPEGRPRVVVVGGGITGLACAWYLRDRADVTVLEAGDRPGGKIATDERWGVPVETGPDVLLARVPWATDLCREVGLGDDLVAPATTRAFVWSGGRLRPLPAGLVLGVPTDLWAVLRSGLLSPAGLLRASLDLVLPRGRARGADPSVADVVGSRFGPEILARLVEPLLGGIHAGRADRLSLRAVAPEVAAAADRHRSLLLGLRRRPAPVSTGPVFQSVRGGLGRLVGRLSAELGPAVRTGTGATSLHARPEGGVTVAAGEETIEADAAVCALPAFAAAPLLAAASPAAGAELAAVRFAPAVTVCLAYEPGAVGHPLDGSGFLVPRGDGRLVTACTFLSSKWPDLARRGRVLLRAFCGWADDDRALHLDDGELVHAVHGELAQALSLRAGPVDHIVTRWPRALAQYEPGHLARIERVRAALSADLPRVVVAGASYGGSGIAACVRQAKEAADACVLSRPG